VRNHAERLTAAQVEVTGTSVPAEVKQEYTIYGVPLLKTPSYCTRVAPNAQSGGEERRAGTGREENVSNGQIHKEKWSGAILTSSEVTAKEGRLPREQQQRNAVLAQKQGQWRLNGRFSAGVYEVRMKSAVETYKSAILFPHRRQHGLERSRAKR
jgi:hypothetical protein